MLRRKEAEDRVNSLPKKARESPTPSFRAHSAFRRLPRPILGPNSGFSIVKTLGLGAFGVVYLAKWEGRTVAAKVFDKSKVSELVIRCAKAEARILGQLEHESIIGCLGQQESESHFVIFLEYFEGQTLEEVIRERKSDREEQARVLFRQLVDGVDFIHRRGFVHRDIKCKNILVNQDMRLKIIDFGFATEAGSQEVLDQFCGTPAFMAPELIAKKGYDGVLVDIWALGVILYYLLVGVLPFKGASEVMMFRKIRRGDFQLPKGLSEGAKHLINKLLVTQPTKRSSMDMIVGDTWLQPVNIAEKLKQLKMRMAK